MTEQELKEIEDRANAATPGPWSYEIDKFYPEDSKLFFGVKAPDAQGRLHADADLYSSLADASFIAHARTDISKLTAEVRRLREVIKKAQHAGDFCDDPSCPWCMARPWEKHTSECPAFLPEGEVK